jgi:protein-tyrosine phosphatase
MKTLMTEQAYKLTWITDQLAVGHAPMSYAELESIKKQGIDAIVNLCAEYCDLHEIEASSGFQVYYLPIRDDHAPDPVEVEKALEWLDEAIYLGKKVFVHCRLGIGRTGTFITSYLLRRGFGLKLAEKQMKKARSTPTSFSQWRFLRKYDKKAGRLTIREPSLETGGRRIDFSPYFDEYESIVQEVQNQLGLQVAEDLEHISSVECENGACARVLILQLVEAAYLLHHLNRKLSQEARLQIIQRALTAHCALLGASPPKSSAGDAVVISERSEVDPGDVCFMGDGEPAEYLCPLFQEGKCLAGSHRPIGCRIWSVNPLLSQEGGEGATCAKEAELSAGSRSIQTAANEALFEISRRLFFALNGRFLDECCLIFPLTEVVSGKYVQSYFRVLASAGPTTN